jgi:Flp pilus assembly protein TadD
VTGGESAATRKLREQAERALARGQGRRVVEPLLERLLRVAAPGSDAALFAHRGLAEYRLQEHPWRALLHLRHVLAAHPDDDVAHAMAGLAHAMSGNYRSAIAAYRAALVVTPDNPWYHHNVGHLLDVALDRPTRAVEHLRLAHEAIGESEPEIASSFAHCLSRLGPRAKVEAIGVIEATLSRHPDHAGARALAAELGAVVPARAPRRGRRARAADATDPPGSATSSSRAAARLAQERPDADDAVIAFLRARLGPTSSRFEAAAQMWRAYVAARARPLRLRPTSAGALAAAVDYAVALTQTPSTPVDDFARAYGVSPRSVTLRYAEIVRTLEAGR